jgi:hypothetical protein
MILKGAIMPTKTKPMPNDRQALPLVQTRVRSLALETMNERELGAILSLFEWVASEQDTAPETVREITQSHFRTEDVSALPSKEYDEVIRFLMDLRIDELCH